VEDILGYIPYSEEAVLDSFPCFEEAVLDSFPCFEEAVLDSFPCFEEAVLDSFRYSMVLDFDSVLCSSEIVVALDLDSYPFHLEEHLG
jgi:hypothetical protein